MPTDTNYDHGAILDDARLGDEPSTEYLQRVSALDNVIRECMYVSKQYSGISSPTSQHFYASVLFTALISRGLSLVILAPNSPWAKKLIEHWDYASAMGVCRTMLELRLAFYYLCVDDCSRTEWEFWNIFNLHDCVSRRRMFETLGTNPEQVAGFELTTAALRDRLMANSYFSALPEVQQKKYLRGHNAYLFALEDIGEKAGVDKRTFRWLYAFFSNHVHGLPMSFYRMGLGPEDRGRGLPSPVEQTYTALGLSFAISLLVHTRDEIRVLFAGLERPVVEPAAELSGDEVQDRVQRDGGLPIGQSMDLVTTEEIRIEVTQTSQSAIDLTYYYRPTNEAVLRRSDSEGEGTILKWFDPVFWSVIVNGKPATERTLAEIEDNRRAFKIDLHARIISLKFEP